MVGPEFFSGLRDPASIPISWNRGRLLFAQTTRGGAQMRIDFISRLGLLLLAGFLVIATQVWAMGTVEWLFIVGGIVMIALAAGSLAQPAGPQRSLDAIVAVLGIWSIVQAIIFDGSTLQ